jgi:23S rRNA G2445 N2-methylase RlmL
MKAGTDGASNGTPANRTGKVVLKKRPREIAGPDITHLFLTCPGGAEEALREELQECGYPDGEISSGVVKVSATADDVAVINRSVRCASRVLVPLTRFHAGNYDEVYRKAMEYPWETLLKPEHSFLISSTARSDVLGDHRFLAMRFKDAIVDRQRKYYGGRRSSVDKETPRVIFTIFSSGKTVELAIDSTGTALHERGYRLEAGDAPLRETVAAMILREGGYRFQDDRFLLDPFCGSGTIVIEAALMWSGRGPGVPGRSWAWQRWPWLKIPASPGSPGRSGGPGRSEVFSGVEGPLFVGTDVDPRIIPVARRNAERAGVSDLVRFETADVADSVPRWTRGRRGMIVTNPPYGVRLQQEDLASLYEQLGELLRSCCGGWDVTILAGNRALLDRLRLRPRWRREIYNGALKCSLNTFRLFQRSGADA